MDPAKQLQAPTDPEMAAICRGFQSNAEAVNRLMLFDRDIVEFARSKVQAIHDEFQTMPSRLARLETMVENALSALTNIRNNQSLRREYRNIHNQGIVLLVSYFSSAVKELFSRAVNERLQRLPAAELPDEAFKVRLSQLRALDVTNLASLVIEKEDLSFQDMGSIARGFQTWIRYNPAVDDDVRTIIAAQASRHVIVHTGGKADEKLLRILKSCKPRHIALDVELGAEIGFGLEELGLVAESMNRYLLRTANGAWAKLPLASREASSDALEG